MDLFIDLDPEEDTFRADVVSGLGGQPRCLPSKYFYDERGSALFDRICGLDEYYLTRTETAILEDNREEIARTIGEHAVLIEYGSGSSTKTRRLLHALQDPAAYVPIDISRIHLLAAAERLSSEFPDLEILPICADYSQRIDLESLRSRMPGRFTVFFPGSTIGNLDREHAREFLQRMHGVAGRKGGVLIGIDLRKDLGVLRRAYDDDSGVTAAFNRNILDHINRRLDADFDPAAFRHTIAYNGVDNRIEMHLTSVRNQTVSVDGMSFEFKKGESILTEYSHKYSLDGFTHLAGAAGFDITRTWTDDRHWFAVLYMEAR